MKIGGPGGPGIENRETGLRTPSVKLDEGGAGGGGGGGPMGMLGNDCVRNAAAATAIPGVVVKLAPASEEPTAADGGGGDAITDCW